MAAPRRVRRLLGPLISCLSLLVLPLPAGGQTSGAGGAASASSTARAEVLGKPAPVGSVRGLVSSRGAPVPFARVVAREASPAARSEVAAAAVADRKGEYLLPALAPGRYTVVASSIGYGPAERAVLVESGRTARADLSLEVAAVAMDPVVVTGTMKETRVSDSAVKVDVIPAAVLERIATNNLMVAIQQVNGLYQQVDCGVCYTNNIRINGMEGPYTAVLIDGMPIMSALASVYGLNGISPSIIERIEIVKGPSSTLYGSEAMGGVVNVITKNPRFAPRMTLDGYRSSVGESSLDFSLAPGVGRVRGLLSGNLSRMATFVDGNGDGFSDVPLSTRASLFAKLDYSPRERRVLGLTAKYYHEDRFGGVEEWTRADRGSGSVYGESISTNRFELLGSYLLPVPSRSLRADLSYTWHDQDSYYGRTAYAAEQSILFGNLVWDRKLGSRHDLLVGATARYQTYDDDTPATAAPERRFIPGVFVQDELRPTDALTLLGGVRVDHHEEHGLIASPRASVKWEPLPDHTLRLNAGTGFRVVSLFTEDHAALSGSRKVVIAETLDPERSYSVALNLNRVLEIGVSPMMIDVDAFYTRFGNKIVPDYDSDPDLIVYQNLRGYSVSRGVSVSLNQNVRFERLLYTLGATLQEVYSVEEGTRATELFAPAARGVLGVTYNHPAPALTLDYTASVTGPMRLPAYEPPFERATRSPTHSVHNLRASWKPAAGVEVYAAANNLLDFTQGSPLVDAANPFGESFDTSYVWGPIHGRELILGARFGLGR